MVAEITQSGGDVTPLYIAGLHSLIGSYQILLQEVLSEQVEAQFFAELADKVTRYLGLNKVPDPLKMISSLMWPGANLKIVKVGGSGWTSEANCPFARAVHPMMINHPDTRPVCPFQLLTFAAIRVTNQKAVMTGMDLTEAGSRATFAEADPDFNGKLLAAINETIHELLGKTVLVALHEHLIRNYAVTTDEIPYRLDTLFEALESVFGAVAAKTIGWRIARNFYSKIGLLFVENENLTLQDYLEQAKKTLSHRE